MSKVAFKDFAQTLTKLGSAPGHRQIDPILQQEVELAAKTICALPEVNRDTLADLVQHYPTWVPYIASCAGVGLEQLKRELQHRLGSAGWKTLAKQRPQELVQALDEAVGLVTEVKIQREKEWTFSDILIDRLHWSSRRGLGSVTRGRRLEDVIQDIIEGFNLKYKRGTTFLGNGKQTAPCDFAIPTNGRKALIVIGVKGFDSTGSKLTDAVREIGEMAAVRMPKQFVFAVVDGMGWKGRMSDLKRIHDFWAKDKIDGLYSMARFDEFRNDLQEAAERLKLIK